MLKKFSTIFLVIFFILVFFDWILSGLHEYIPQGNGLATVDFSFFLKKNSKNYITQGYGSTAFSLFNYVGHRHNGIDIAAQYGAPVLSATDGTVVSTGNQDQFCYKRGFGKFIAVQSDKDNLVLFYAHLGEIKVKAGTKVTKEQTIGAVGASGFETGIHLHFSVFDATNFQMKNKNGCGPDPDGKDLDPMKYIKEFE